MTNPIATPEQAAALSAATIELRIKQSELRDREARGLDYFRNRELRAEINAAQAQIDALLGELGL